MGLFSSSSESHRLSFSRRLLQGHPWWQWLMFSGSWIYFVATCHGSRVRPFVPHGVTF